MINTKVITFKKKNNKKWQYFFFDESNPFNFLGSGKSKKDAKLACSREAIHQLFGINNLKLGILFILNY